MEPSEDGPPPAEAITPAPAVDMAAVLDAARSLLGDMRALAHDQLQLLALEIERAAQGLAHIALLSVAAGLLLAGIWLGLSVALAFWLMELGLRTSLAILLACGMNLLGLWMVLQGILRESQVLGFPGTRKSLQRMRKPASPTP